MARPAAWHDAGRWLGRDTRESGDWIERELARGLGARRRSDQRRHYSDAGRRLPHAGGRFDAGVVISASHNPFEDNGIKVFSATRREAERAVERQVESIVADDVLDGAAGAGDGRDATTDCRRTTSTTCGRFCGDPGPLAGSRIVRRLRQRRDDADRARALPIARFRRRCASACEPDGRNINLGCGSTHLELLQARVVADGARLGIAFDGDGDRAIFVDRLGRVVDGDAVMLMAADQLKAKGALTGNAIVATVMSNIGLEIALRERGIELVRCPVGDKYVMEEMQRRGWRSAASSRATSSSPSTCSPATASARR